MRFRTPVRARLVEPLEVADLALAEHQDAALAQVGVEARQRQPGLLRVRDGDAAIEPLAAGQQLEVEAPGRREVAEDRPDGDAGGLV